MDNKTPAERSKNMASVRSKNTRPELLIRSCLHRLGYRFRLHRKDIPGHPDIVLPKHKVVIFVNGCFWHGHSGCNKSKLPTTNVEFWKNKIEGNKKRDNMINKLLLDNGWRVCRIWECALRTVDSRKKLPEELKNWISGDEKFGELPRS